MNVQSQADLAGYYGKYTFFWRKTSPSEEILIKICQYNNDKYLQLV